MSKPLGDYEYTQSNDLGDAYNERSEYAPIYLKAKHAYDVSYQKKKYLMDCMITELKNYNDTKGIKQTIAEMTAYIVKTDKYTEELDDFLEKSRRYNEATVHYFLLKDKWETIRTFLTEKRTEL